MQKENYKHCAVCLSCDGLLLKCRTCTTMYHRKCINEWTKKNDACSVCKVSPFFIHRPVAKKGIPDEIIFCPGPLWGITGTTVMVNTVFINRFGEVVEDF
jgi:hypothetical protein